MDYINVIKINNGYIATRHNSIGADDDFFFKEKIAAEKKALSMLKQLIAELD